MMGSVIPVTTETPAGSPACCGSSLCPLAPRKHPDRDALAVAFSAFDQEASDLAVVVEEVALDGVQQGLGEVVEVHPGRIADVLHNDLDDVVSPGRARLPLLAHELIDQGLVVFGLGGQAVDGDLDGVAALSRAHLACADPAGGHARFLTPALPGRALVLHRR